MCIFSFIWDSTFLCYLAVVLTCGGLAIADLLGRFKSGNRITTILIGRPQFFFYLLIVGAGVLVLFGSEALGKTQILNKASTNLPLGIVYSSALALATFISIRTTVTTLSSDKKIEIGPGRLFAALLENVERRIDQERMVKVSREIQSIAPLVAPRAVLYVVLPYCFEQAEKNMGDRNSITNILEAIYTSKQHVHQVERSALMLSHLHKIFGLEVLKAALELVAKEPTTPENRTPVMGEMASPNNFGDSDDALNELKSSTTELDSLLRQLLANK